MTITADRASDFYTTYSLGPNQSETKEGFLLCANVPVARTGAMIYAPAQVPVAPGPSGYVLIERDEDEVFRAETMASIVGKPVVNEHPEHGVMPDNARLLTAGVMLNPRRGEGDQDDLLLADLLIFDRDTIQAIRDGKREVSLGYEADYEQVEPGKGRQRNIIVNHVALVQQGRCGPRCAIGDSATGTEDTSMTKRSFVDRVRDAFKTKDEGKLEEVLAEAGNGDGTHIHIHTADNNDPGPPEDPIAALTKRMGDMETGFAAMKDALDKRFKDAEEDKPEKDKTKDAEAEEAENRKKADDAEVESGLEREGVAKDKKTADSDCLSDAFQVMRATAEIIVPGMSVPTFDRAAAPKLTLDALCSTRRKTLEAAYSNPQVQPLITEMLGGRAMDLSKMTCDAVAMLFTTVGSAMKARNTSGIRPGEFALPTQHSVGAKTISDIEKRNRDFYGKK